MTLVIFLAVLGLVIVFRERQKISEEIAIGLVAISSAILIPYGAQITIGIGILAWAMLSDEPT